jgi:antitoxin component of MazEF toxin-antitoxin module
MHGTIKVRKIGGSLAIIIPQFVAHELKIKAGHPLRMTYDETTIKLTTGPTDQQRLDAYITQLLIENEQIARGVKLR